MSTKISALPASPGLVLTDIFPFVDDPGGVPVTQKATFSQLQTLLSSGMVASFNTRVGAVSLTLADVSTVADARYVLKAGDTMTGSLAISTGTLTATFTSGNSAFTALNANVSAVSPTLVLSHALSSGTAAVGLGTRLDMVGDTNGGSGQILLRIDTSWTDAVQATRTSQLIFAQAIAGASLNTLILVGGQLELRDGLVGTPAYTFQNDPDSGLYRIGANNLGVTVGGGLVLSASATTGIILSTSLTLPYVAKTATYTASAVDYTIDCTTGTFTINLPTAVGITGRIYVIKNSGVGTITIDPSGAQTIDGLATSPVTSGGAAMIQSNGANWIII